MLEQGQQSIQDYQHRGRHRQTKLLNRQREESDSENRKSQRGIEGHRVETGNHRGDSVDLEEPAGQNQQTEPGGEYPRTRQHRAGA